MFGLWVWVGVGPSKTIEKGSLKIKEIFISGPVSLKMLH